MSSGELFVFQGNPYRRYPSSRFKQASTYFTYHPSNNKRILLHRAIWEHYNGEIPKGYDIHHKDGNPSNNDISNLECCTRKEHFRKHSELAKTDPSLDKYKNSRRWHGSEAGFKHHSKIASESWKTRQMQDVSCCQCEKKFKSHNTSVSENYFCCGYCQTKHRRLSGVDNMEGKCSICEKMFMYNKYKLKVTCGRSCQSLQRKKTMSRK